MQQMFDDGAEDVHKQSMACSAAFVGPFAQKMDRKADIIHFLCTFARVMKIINAEPVAHSCRMNADAGAKARRNYEV